MAEAAALMALSDREHMLQGLSCRKSRDHNVACNIKNQTERDFRTGLVHNLWPLLHNGVIISRVLKESVLKV